MSERFDAFKAELIALLDRHGLMLSSSLYDPPRISERGDGEQAIYQDCLEDGTEQADPN